MRNILIAGFKYIKLAIRMPFLREDGSKVELL